MLNILHVSEMELENVAKKYDLENDSQTRRFCEFISIAANFASLKFAERLPNIPELIDSIKELIIEMVKEVKDFADTAAEFENIIQCYIRLVLSTKHNMKMMVPHLDEAKTHMKVTVDTLAPESSEPSVQRDKDDIQIALRGMSSSVRKLLELAQSSKEKSDKLDERIAAMKRNVQNKKLIMEGRIDFSESSPMLGLGLGIFAGSFKRIDKEKPTLFSSFKRQKIVTVNERGQNRKVKYQEVSKKYQVNSRSYKRSQ
ncbi:unnamed protein product [Didymodactylos carnosus]|uniref:Uncharacterized protein n=1 Tax=Didymodactylos carnosus TaxID=1234261 RepID=A0A815KC02_9BILA|nr:unnamed protein product [Didymodactylos carnosus]CAF4285869.1 unnamed protein product [Didymodactylos carnosus]